jgi:hypothetical protein
MKKRTITKQMRPLLQHCVQGPNAAGPRLSPIAPVLLAQAFVVLARFARDAHQHGLGSIPIKAIEVDRLENPNMQTALH